MLRAHVTKAQRNGPSVMLSVLVVESTTHPDGLNDRSVPVVEFAVAAYDAADELRYQATLAWVQDEPGSTPTLTEEHVQLMRDAAGPVIDAMRKVPES